MVRAMKRGNHGSAEKGEGNISLDEIEGVSNEELLQELSDTRDQLQAQIQEN
jgi:hypothetical protein